MTAVPVAQQITAEAFLALPVSHSGWPAELIDGEVVVNDPAAFHGHIQTNLLLALESWARARPGRGSAVFPRDVAIDDHNVFKPDLLWYSDGRLPDPLSPPPYAVPDLAVEVRSASTWRYDVGTKKAGYERRGLPELWLVDTVARSVLVFRRSRSATETFDTTLELSSPAELTSPLLLGFALALDEVFRTP